MKIIMDIIMCAYCNSSYNLLVIVKDVNKWCSRWVADSIQQKHFSGHHFLIHSNSFMAGNFIHLWIIYHRYDDDDDDDDEDNNYHCCRNIIY